MASFFTNADQVISFGVMVQRIRHLVFTYKGIKGNICVCIYLK